MLLRIRQSYYIVFWSMNPLIVEELSSKTCFMNSNKNNKLPFPTLVTELCTIVTVEETQPLRRSPDLLPGAVCQAACIAFVGRTMEVEPTPVCGPQLHRVVHDGQARCLMYDARQRIRSHLEERVQNL